MAGWIFRLKEVTMEILLTFKMRQPNGTEIRTYQSVIFWIGVSTPDTRNEDCLLYTSQILNFESLMAIFNDISIEIWF